MYTNQLILPNQDPDVRRLSDEIDWETMGNNVLKRGLDSAQKEAGNYIDKTLKKTLGTEQSEKSSPPIQAGGSQVSYEQMNKQATSNGNSMVETAKNVSPIIVGLVGMGISKLAGLGWVASASIGAGAGAGKYLLIDRKQ